jgi:murein DD-endopeptidase MepM/ murein hydrolase activator NlpD
LLCLGLIVAVALFFMLTQNRDSASSAQQPATPPQTLELTQTILALTPLPSATPSLTRTPPPMLPTVTLTVSPTPTPGPCEFTIQAGDTLFGLASQCGYSDPAIVDVILAFNNISDPAALQLGQVIQVPRPTATLAAIAGQNEVVDSEQDLNGDGEISADEIIAARQEAAEPTLDPNLQYHIVAAGQTMIDIVLIYNIDAKLLSEINPEIEFPQCDFGIPTGGPTCAVFLSEGQRVRVPAPTPTATIPPTASGSETPTPSPTPTINIPQAIAPEDGANFDAASIVTLRWATSGTLGQDELYVVRVKNLQTNQEFIGVTCDLSFDLPTAWQPSDTNQFIAYEWRMAVANASPFGTGQDAFGTRFAGLSLCRISFQPPITWDASPTGVLDYGIITDFRLGDERFPTAPRRFNWQGRE